MGFLSPTWMLWTGSRIQTQKVQALALGSCDYLNYIESKLLVDTILRVYTLYHYEIA